MKHSADNKLILFAEIPTGIPNENTFQIKSIDMPTISEGEVLLKTLYVSVDPGMRGFMKKGSDDHIGNKFEIGKPITSRTVAQVLESKSADLKKGTTVHARLSWQKYQTISADQVAVVDPDLGPISTAVSILGVPGLAAYFGLLKVGEIKKGQTVLVSGAAGGVGSVAVQIAKIKGCRVIGIAGSEEKIRYLTDDLKIDSAINYKETDDLKNEIKTAFLTMLAVRLSMLCYLQ